MRTYSVVMAGTSITAAKDLLRLSASSGTILEILRIEVTQSSSTTSAQNALSIYRASTDGTGTSASARPYQAGDPTFAGTAVVNLSADTTKSPTEPLWRSGQNVLNGWLWHPVPEERIIVPPSGRLAVRLENSPGTLTMTCTCVFMEIG